MKESKILQNPHEIASAICSLVFTLAGASAILSARVKSEGEEMHPELATLQRNLGVYKGKKWFHAMACSTAVT